MVPWIDLFDGRLDVHPPLAEEQMAAIPARRGAVALLGEHDEPIVLLTAADIRSRLRARLQQPTQEERKKTADLRQITRTILWKLAGGHFEADLHFLELSQAIWPEGYGRMLAWKWAWFVHVDPQAKFPHFVRTRDVLGSPGQYVGPFGDGRSAERLIQAVQDAFDLCRDYNCLRQAPRGPRCAYAQMGRCLSPADGGISMEDYREVIARAAQFAAGDRQPCRQELQARMKIAAAALRFEEAAECKSRLERLAEFDKPYFAHVARAEQFQFILVQAGGSRAAKVFLVDRGAVKAADGLDYPLKAPQLDKLLKDMAGFAAAPKEIGAAERWRIGLVAHYLFGGIQRRGLIIRWSESTTARQLSEAIESSAEGLKLRAPKPRKRKEGPSGNTRVH